MEENEEEEEGTSSSGVKPKCDRRWQGTTTAVAAPRAGYRRVSLAGCDKHSVLRCCRSHRVMGDCWTRYRVLVGTNQVFFTATYAFSSSSIDEVGVSGGDVGE